MIALVDSCHSSAAALLRVLLISFVQSNHLSPTPPFLSLSVVVVRLSLSTLLFNIFSYFRLFLFFFGLISSGIIFPALYFIPAEQPYAPNMINQG